MPDETVINVQFNKPDLDAKVPDTELQEIEDALMLPSSTTCRRMARELRKWRGDKNPDAA
jgi:hypothetical protein